MSPEMETIVKQAVKEAVKETVNGKIDRLDKKIDDHNSKHELDMSRIMPIIKAYEASEEAVNTAKRGGKAILWSAGFVTAVGGAFLVIKQILHL